VSRCHRRRAAAGLSRDIRRPDTSAECLLTGTAFESKTEFSTSMKYRVNRAFIGVRRANDDSFQFVTLEPGNAFTIRGEERNGQVKVIYRGKMILVFMEDIRQRAVKIRQRLRADSS
jgi:hypothetical protein